VAVHTPGHTPGHLALFLERSGILITGDAINVVEGKLTGANPLHTHDAKAAVASLAKLSRFDVRGAISYHGGYLAGDLNPVIAELALAA
jgi:glyoxylase-like metal-dependent hydrolase (beta-lactamase superfamily II)